MGRGGLSYRKTLRPVAQQNTPTPPQMGGHSASLLPQHETHAPLQEIESGTVFAMTDSDSAELLDELNNKRKKWRFFPATLGAGLLVSFFTPWPLPLMLLTLMLSVVAYYYDKLRKTAVLLYELDEEVEPLYEALHHAIAEMGACKKVWHIEAAGKVYDKKYHAGADSLVKRKSTFITKREPPFVRTNISVPAVGVGKQTLFFFPDRVLVFENNAVGTVSYGDLRLNVYTSQFIEDESVPKDSVIVGKTWKYVNKRGGPDRRFNPNPEIPIVQYEYVSLASESGLSELICLSCVGKSGFFEKALGELAKVVKA